MSHRIHVLICSKMASSQFIGFWVIVVTLLLQGSHTVVEAQLRPDFYSASCPLLPATVRSIVNAAILLDPRMGASILRLFYLDCFVAGCDASILLGDTSNFTGEQNAVPNRDSARGFSVIESIKSSVEFVCPGVVSCADILAIAARDSVVSLGGPSWSVQLGRRDARTASQALADISIPGPLSSLSDLITTFDALGFTTRDMVALLGAHTIGQARCTNFRTRIYNETNIDPNFATLRQRSCPRDSGSGDGYLAPLDVNSPISFDNSYFKNLMAQRGLLHSDQELFNGGSITDLLVHLYGDNQSIFFSDFAAAMFKMGAMSPLTGNLGEIRRVCMRVN